MSDIFGAVYADAYNSLYGNKDYAAECNLIEGLFKRYSEGSVSSLLDLGCGTGNHAFLLSERGYDVLGVDQSENMLALARRRLSQNPNGGRLHFESGDIRQLNLDREFDAALIMFAVLGYQLEDRDVLATLKTARRHLKLGALLIFDVWYGPAVLHQRPSGRTQVIPTNEGKLMREASGELDVQSHTCIVRYRLRRFSGDRLVDETEETHRMRYFFPGELDLFLECSGFSPVRLGVFPGFDEEPNETTWNVTGVARAV